VRDLVRRPLIGDELVDFDAVVFDPPREGADDQVRALAAARVKTVIGVSCNPTTFARDAKTLVDAGYRLATVTPVDQFLWSPHLELVGAFRR
jgi:23S rRNA (uracil1939-C5)-methyltransferase